MSATIYAAMLEMRPIRPINACSSSAGASDQDQDAARTEGANGTKTAGATDLSTGMKGKASRPGCGSSDQAITAKNAVEWTNRSRLPN
jgi:hypothetical protein